ncbi:acyl-CoA thioesterase [candidate division WOR-3 bacterium]|nr:acyl-CoA thioesterase [candidate division WOR-3 bacterium]
MNSISRLVKSEDLNHHGTLYAGRMADWFVEAAFIEANMHYGNPEELVCLKIHGLKFSAPAKKGDIIKIDTSLAYTGKTSITVYGHVSNALHGNETIVEGFVTFVSIDKNGRKKPHNIVFAPKTEEEKRIYNEAIELRKNEQRSRKL